MIVQAFREANGLLIMQKGEGRCLEKIKWEERDDDEDVGTVDDVNDMGYFIIVKWSPQPRHLDIRPIVTHCIDACPGNDDDGDDDGDDDDDDDDDGDDDDDDEDEKIIPPLRGGPSVLT